MDICACVCACARVCVTVEEREGEGSEAPQQPTSSDLVRSGRRSGLGRGESRS